jgi:hypothetical protein
MVVVAADTLLPTVRIGGSAEAVLLYAPEHFRLVAARQPEKFTRRRYRQQAKV